jgi:hypothetical protein
MKLDEETKTSNDGKQEESSTKQFTLCRHCDVELQPEQVIKTRFGHVIGDDDKIFLCDHSALCRHCYDELVSFTRSYVRCNEGENMVRKPDELTVGLDLKVFKVDGKWILDDVQRKAAWEMYVELVTRISVAELKPDEGLLREALSSLYTLFGTTRQILREHGPIVAQPKRGGTYTFGYLSIVILNCVLRPVLAKWHPLLSDYEHSRKEGTSTLEHERKWEHAQELREKLNETRIILIDYANELAKAAEIPSLIIEDSKCRATN